MSVTFGNYTRVILNIIFTIYKNTVDQIGLLSSIVVITVGLGLVSIYLAVTADERQAPDLPLSVKNTENGLTVDANFLIYHFYYIFPSN